MHSWQCGSGLTSVNHVSHGTHEASLYAPVFLAVSQRTRIRCRGLHYLREYSRSTAGLAGLCWLALNMAKFRRLMRVSIIRSRALRRCKVTAVIVMTTGAKTASDVSVIRPFIGQLAYCRLASSIAFYPFCSSITSVVVVSNNIVSRLTDRFIPPFKSRSISCFMVSIFPTANCSKLDSAMKVKGERSRMTSLVLRS